MEFRIKQEQSDGEEYQPELMPDGRNHVFVEKNKRARLFEVFYDRRRAHCEKNRSRSSQESGSDRGHIQDNCKQVFGLLSAQVKPTKQAKPCRSTPQGGGVGIPVLDSSPNRHDCLPRSVQFIDFALKFLPNSTESIALPFVRDASFHGGLNCVFSLQSTLKQV